MDRDTAPSLINTVRKYFNLLDEKQWRNSVTTQVRKVDNKCHSLSRFNCYKVDKDLTAQESNDRLKTDKAHLFYNAVDCAQQVLSASFIKSSFVVFALLVAFLF